MLRFHQIEKSYGARAVLLGVSFDIPNGACVALVGPNGAGKSTLLRIAAGEEPADGGRVIVDSGDRVAYLPQDAGVRSNRTLWDELLSAFEELMLVRDELAAVGHDLRLAAERGAEVQALAERQGHLHERFEALGGYRVEAEVAAVLDGLGFSPEDREKRTLAFSGGWQMRIALAKLLAQRPDVLLLDEPTNHLDIAATEWLEEYLTGYRGSVLIVSHDRYFLDRVANRTVELERGTATVYTGGYTAYADEKARRLDAQRAAYERQQKQLAEQQAYIERFRASATRSTQAKSREKMLGKIEKVGPPPPPPPAVALRFVEARPSSQEVAVLDVVAKRYGERTVLDGIGLRLERGERIGLVGPNGAGKSTLLRLLAGLERPSGGYLKVSDTAAVGYFAQDQAEALDPDHTLLEELRGSSGTDWGEDRIRALLGRFLFSGEDVFKRIGLLSGGEKSRVALAKLLLRPVNVLLLDEPTNHLDPVTKERLEEALRRFKGTVIIASHDRFLLDRVVTKIGEVADGGLKLYLGGYSAFRGRSATPAGGQAVAPTPGGAAKDEPSHQPQFLPAWLPEPARPGTSQKPQRKRGPKGASPVEAVEREIAALVTQREALSERLAAPDGEDVSALGEQYVELEEAIAALEERWDLLVEEASA